jgi:hypothetical protein
MEGVSRFDCSWITLCGIYLKTKQCPHHLIIPNISWWPFRCHGRISATINVRGYPAFKFLLSNSAYSGYPELWILWYPAHRYHAVPLPGFEPTTLSWLRVRRPNHSATTLHAFKLTQIPNHATVTNSCSTVLLQDPPCSKSMHLHSFIETWDPACFFVLARLQSWTCEKLIWCLLRQNGHISGTEGRIDKRIPPL